MLLGLGLGWPDPLQGLNNLKTISSMVQQVLYSQQAVTHSHPRSGQSPGSLEARSESCSALPLKPKQDYLISLTACMPAVTSVLSDSLLHYGLYSTPGSSVHGILQARILELVAISFSIYSLLQSIIFIIRVYIF